MDGFRIATMAPGTFAVVPVCAGPHTFTTRALAGNSTEQKLRDLWGRDSQLELRAQAGWNYFVKLDVDFRASGTSFEEVERSDGKAEVMDCQLVEESYMLDAPKCPMEKVDGL